MKLENNSEKTFKELVESLSSHDIIMALVNGLKKRHVVIKMSTFGDSKQGVCYGCGATNALCEISGKVFSSFEISGRNSRADFLNTDSEFLEIFEGSIDLLRRGSVDAYNIYSCDTNISKIELPFRFNLPFLGDNFTDEDLDKYIELAKYQNKNIFIKIFNKILINLFG